MTAIVGQKHSLTVTFMKNGEFFSPDDSSVSYTVFDNSGTPITGATNQSVTFTSGAQEILFEIPAAVQTVAPDKKFEERTVLLTYQVNNISQSLELYYRVSPRRNIRVTPAQVISRTGLKIGEVYEEDVDLLSAYIRLSTQFEDFDTFLTSGDALQVSANKAIEITAALDLLTAVELKALKKAGGDQLSYTRFDGIDFDKIRRDLMGEIGVVIVDLGYQSGADIYAVGSTSIDAITGA